jgi:hypothetical protein
MKIVVALFQLVQLSFLLVEQFVDPLKLVVNFSVTVLELASCVGLGSQSIPHVLQQLFQIFLLFFVAFNFKLQLSFYDIRHPKSDCPLLPTQLAYAKLKFGYLLLEARILNPNQFG